jgi:hypothetical protein
MKKRIGGGPTDRTRPIKLTPKLIRRFRPKVDTTAGPDQCWPWIGKTQNGGYGVLWFGGKTNTTFYAHRLAYLLETGIDPHGRAVCHRCDNPPCCNPAHLFLGTIADNTQDMMTKGRWRRPPQAKGVQIASAKVNEAIVRDIRRRAAGGASSAVLGREYGLDSSSVRQIVRRETWAHVAEVAQ